MKWVLEQHFSEVAAIIGGRQFSQLDRAKAHLDGLRIGRTNSLSLAREIINSGSDDCDDYIPAVVLGVEIGDDNDITKSVELLGHEDRDIRNSVRIGLRFASVSRCLNQLAEAYNAESSVLSAAAQDVLSFHRKPLSTSKLFLNDEDVDLHYLTFESVGRQFGSLPFKFLDKGLQSNSPRVRSATLRSACRSHLSLIRENCLDRAVAKQCCESIYFFGMLSKYSDCQTLLDLLHSQATTHHAIAAIGKSGWAVLLPDLIQLLREEEFAESAAIAFERITGHSVPRGESVAPPDDLDEDEKDFWVGVGAPDADLIEQWWKENSCEFDDAKRYQEGQLRTIQEPLTNLRSLSLEVAQDEYLRQSAYNPNLDDWELETWPSHWHEPDWQ